MLTLHIEAATFNELVAKTASALGAAVEQPAPVQPVKEPATNDEPELPLNAAPVVEAPKAKRGRKPNTAPQTAGAPEGDSAGSQPAVEQNTGSAQSETPAEVDASETDAGADVSASAAVSKEEMREVLNKVVDKFTTPKDGNMPGLEAVAKIITKHGYQRVKDVQEEHYAAIAADAAAALSVAA